MIYDLDPNNILQNEEKATSHQKKHTKMRYNSQSLFCKTYILEQLIAKASSAKIYFAMNFFIKVNKPYLRFDMMSYSENQFMLTRLQLDKNIFYIQFSREYSLKYTRE